MTRFRQLFFFLAAAVTASIGGGTGTDSIASPLSPPGQLVANDCRAPDALTSQRGCRSSTRVMATR